MIPRVIPCLLLKGRGLVKTVQFAKPKYLGDPINIIRIFNDKEVDEIALLDIEATIEARPPVFDYLRDLASECFMPLAYGGGIRSIKDMEILFGVGMEKVILNTIAVENPAIIKEAAERFGSQSVVVSLDVRRRLFGKYEVVVRAGTKATGLDPVDYARQAQDLGAGEILLTSVDRDGTFKGYDIDLIQRVSAGLTIPLIAAGGARNIEDLAECVDSGGASAAAAGNMFVFQGPHRAVLISYPEGREIEQAFDRAHGQSTRADR